MKYSSIKAYGDIAMAIHQSETIWRRKIESLNYTKSWDAWGERLTYSIDPKVKYNLPGFLDIGFNYKSFYKVNKTVYFRVKINGETVTGWDYVGWRRTGSNYSGWEYIDGRFIESYVSNSKGVVTGSPEEGLKVRVPNPLALDTIEIYFETESEEPPVNDMKINFTCNYLYE